MTTMPHLLGAGLYLQSIIRQKIDAIPSVSISPEQDDRRACRGHKRMMLKVTCQAKICETSVNCLMPFRRACISLKARR